MVVLFDIFLSHSWVVKPLQPLLSHVYKSLTALGYRVWYDQLESDFKPDESMKIGIENSTFFLACVSRRYQSRPHSMFELEEAVKTR